MAQFDKDWGAPATATPATPAANLKAESVKTEGPGTKTESKEEAFDWDTCFKDSPKKLETLKAKFPSDLMELPGPMAATSFFVAPGPQLFILAKEACEVRAVDGPFLSYGAGVWITGDKVTKFVANNPGKGVPCGFQDDQVVVTMEDLWWLSIPTVHTTLEIRCFQVLPLVTKQYTIKCCCNVFITYVY